jgi:hypothetical protein
MKLDAEVGASAGALIKKEQRERESVPSFFPLALALAPNWARRAKTLGWTGWKVHRASALARVLGRLVLLLA